MTPANPLVADAADTATPFSGTFLLEDGEQLVSAIQSGDWIAGGLATFSAIADTAAAVTDPIGTLIAMGLGWLMDHVEPLKGWMNDLTGDAGEVQGFAATWGNVSQYLTETGAQLASRIADVQEMSGRAITAYRALQSDIADHVTAAANWASGMKTGMEIASMIVQIVHDLVRDTLSQLVGSLISYATEAVVTLGLGTPAIIAQASARVASLSSRVIGTINKLVDAVGTLSKHLDELKALLSQLGDILKSAVRGGGGKKPDTHPGVSSPDPHPESPEAPAAGGGGNESAPGAHASGATPPNFEQGVRFFGEDQMSHYTSTNPTLGRTDPVFFMPYDDATRISSPTQAMFESGMANSVTQAVENGRPVYAAVIDTGQLPQRLPTAADAGGWKHFLPGGHTAINIDGRFFPNSTREFVVDGGSPLPPTLIYRLHDNGEWEPIGFAKG